MVSLQVSGNDTAKYLDSVADSLLAVSTDFTLVHVDESNGCTVSLDGASICSMQVNFCLLIVDFHLGPWHPESREK